MPFSHRRKNKIGIHRLMKAGIRVTHIYIRMDNVFLLQDIGVRHDDGRFFSTYECRFGVLDEQYRYNECLSAMNNRARVPLQPE